MERTLERKKYSGEEKMTQGKAGRVKWLREGHLWTMITTLGGMTNAWLNGYAKVTYVFVS